MLEEGLINHPVVGFGESGRKANDLRILLRKIEESEVQFCTLYLHDYFLFPIVPRRGDWKIVSLIREFVM